MKSIIPIIIFILMASLASAISECQTEMEPDEVPCLVLLPSTAACSTIEISSFDNATLPIKTETMGTHSPFMCNSTFTFTAVGIYAFNYTTGDTGSITIKEGRIMEFLLYFVAALAIIFLVIALWKQDTNFAFFSGFMFMILGIFIFRNGFSTLSNFATESAAIILMGIGAYITFRATIEHLNEA